MFKKFVQQAAAEESTGGVASRLRWGCFQGENAAGGLFQHPPADYGRDTAWRQAYRL